VLIGQSTMEGTSTLDDRQLTKKKACNQLCVQSNGHRSVCCQPPLTNMDHVRASLCVNFVWSEVFTFSICLL
jgi:hypothetical protein